MGGLFLWNVSYALMYTVAIPSSSGMLVYHGYKPMASIDNRTIFFNLRFLYEVNFFVYEVKFFFYEVQSVISYKCDF